MTYSRFQALQGQPMTIYGDGTQTRSFQYVSDLVAGLVALMNGNYTRPVNLGNPEEVCRTHSRDSLIHYISSSALGSIHLLII